jgi:hypothetical protein
MLGWQTKPLGALFDHPLFSLPGLLHFLDGLCRDFWRGRFMWNGEFMAQGWADAVYVATSAIFLAAATLVVARGLLRWLREGRAALSDESSVQTAAWLMVAGGVGLLAFFSIWILTGERSVPPRSDPFFTMGRLIAGCTVPFVLLYVCGLGSATTWIPGRARAAVRAVLLGLVVTTVLVSEVWLSMPAARSEYGWLRLPRAEFGPCAASTSRRSGSAQKAEDHSDPRRPWSAIDDPD